MKKTKQQLFNPIAWCIFLWVCPSAIHAFSGSGSGTNIDPFRISSASEFLEITDAPDAHYQMVSDISFSGAKFPNFIISEFSGTLDGQGHAVLNFELIWSGATPSTRVGIFSSLSGSLQNLKVRDARASLIGQINSLSESGSGIGNEYNIGLLAGTMAGGDVRNCHVSGKVLVNVSIDVAGGVEGSSGAVDLCAGGMVGMTLGSSFEKCSAACDVSVVVTEKISMVEGGGLTVSVGGLVGARGDLIACRSSGQVRLWFNTQRSSLQLVGGPIAFLGGMAGRGATSSDSYSIANVEFFGHGGLTVVKVGGYIGTSGANSRCYSRGPVSAQIEIARNFTVGGFAGGASGNSNYFSIEGTGQSTSAGASPLLLHELTDASSFTDWDFLNIWIMSPDGPELRNLDSFEPIFTEWYPWSKIGSVDLWASFPVAIHQNLQLPFPQGALTASENSTPLTNKQQIADLAVAMQAKLVAQETGFWDQSFIDPDDVEVSTTDVGFATEGFTYTGDFVLGTPGVAEADTAANWEGVGGWIGDMWPDTGYNKPFRFAIPSDGSDQYPAEFDQVLNEAWRAGAQKRWIDPAIRRRAYAEAFIFAMFPQGSTYSSVSSEIRQHYADALDRAAVDSLLGTAIENGDIITQEIIADYFNVISQKIATDYPAEEARVAGAVLDFFFTLTGVEIPAGHIVDLVGNTVLAGDQHRVLCEVLFIRLVEEQRVKRRKDYLLSVFGRPSQRPSWWTYRHSGNTYGWEHDPAILYGLGDACARVDSMFAAGSSDGLALDLFTKGELWQTSDENFMITVISGIVETAFHVLLPSDPFTDLVIIAWKGYELTKEFIDFLESDRIEAANAFNMMFCAGTIDYYLGDRQQNLPSESLADVRKLQTRSNIRMTMAAIYYGSLLRNDSRFHGHLPEPYADRLSQGYSDSLAAVSGDYLMSNPISGADAVRISSAAYVASSVPGIINPPGQFSLTVAAGTGGTTSGSGFRVEDMQAAITAFADPGYRFGSWSGSGIADPSKASTTVLMDSDKTVTANFLNEWTVTIVANPALGGSVSGGGIGVSGETVSISAGVNSGYRFGGWSGASGIADPSSLSTTVTTNADKTATAIFVKQWTLTLNNANPTGGTVSSGGIFDEGTHGITASPGGGYRFGGWTGAGITDVNDPTTTVSLVQDRTITGSFLINSTDAYNAYSTVFGGETDINKIGPNMDFDGDLKTNFHEFVFGLNPTSPANEADAVASMLQRGENTYGQLAFNARSDDDEITYKVWVSGDLVNWTPVTIIYSDGTWSSSNQTALTVEAQTNRGDGTWNLTVEDKTPVNGPRFIKVSAESPYNN